MAKKKARKSGKRPAKRAVKATAKAPVKRTAKAPVKRAAKKTRAKKQAAKQSHVPTEGLYGWITHTDIASTNPAATKAWCAVVFGWAFRPPVPMPNGDYHLFAYSPQGGGGMRVTDAGETPHSVPFVHVADAHAAFEKAIRAGAEAISPPMRVAEGVTVAAVRAPGGVPIGISGP